MSGIGVMLLKKLLKNKPIKLLVAITAIIKTISTFLFFWLYEINHIFMPFIWFSIPYFLAAFYDDTITKPVAVGNLVLLFIIIIISIIIPIMLLAKKRKVLFGATSIYFFACVIDMVCSVISYCKLESGLKIVSIVINILIIIVSSLNLTKNTKRTGDG